MTKKKKGKGGAREGAGRPAGEPSIRIRVPVSKFNQVMAIINGVPEIEVTDKE
jgi:hypothetical protein